MCGTRTTFGGLRAAWLGTRNNAPRRALQPAFIFTHARAALAVVCTRVSGGVEVEFCWPCADHIVPGTVAPSGAEG